MASNDEYAISGKTSLTPDETAAIRMLTTICRARDGLDLGLDPNDLGPQGPRDVFLAEAAGGLVGYVTLLSFGSPTIEVNGMVHPDWRRRGIGRALLAAAEAEARARGGTALLLTCERASIPGQAFVRAAGGEPRFSEYKMERTGGEAPPPVTAPLRLTPATAADAELLVDLYRSVFEDAEEEVRIHVGSILSDARRKIQIAHLEAAPIGMITTIAETEHAYIAGFGVRPEYRGRGYGRQILALAIGQILATGQQHIELDVETDNQNALGLYESCGFRQTTIYDYSELRLT